MPTELFNDSIVVPLGIGGFICGTVAERVVVPYLVRTSGSRQLASPFALSGCRSSFLSAVFAVMLQPFLSMYGASPFWSFPLVFAAIIILDLGLLSFYGSDARLRQWNWQDGKILGINGEKVHPTYVGCSGFYTQTDAFSGYTQYNISLYENDQRIASNSYNSESEYESDILALDRLFQPRRLDLDLVWRVSKTRWSTFSFGSQWGILLGNSLENLDEESRDWWRQWLLPRFPLDREVKINVEEWRTMLGKLQSAYPDYWAAYETWDSRSETADPKHPHLRPGNWSDHLPRIEWLFNTSNSAIFAMTSDQKQKSGEEAVGSKVTWTLNFDGVGSFEELRPL